MNNQSPINKPKMHWSIECNPRYILAKNVLNIINVITKIKIHFIICFNTKIHFLFEWFFFFVFIFPIIGESKIKNHKLSKYQVTIKLCPDGFPYPKDQSIGFTYAE